MAHHSRSNFGIYAVDYARGLQNETVELALAHSIKSQPERAYRRDDQLDKRRGLMGAWGRYVEVDQSKIKSKVVAMKRRQAST